MAITTYAELQTAVANWMHRSNLNSRIPEFIAMGEASLNREIRSSEMIETATVNTSASDRYAALPTRCTELTALVNQYGDKLILANPDNVAAISANASAGLPEYYAITDRIEFDRASDQVYALTCLYRKRLDIAADSTNWLLTNHPDAYLYASLFAASPYIKDDARVAMVKGLMDEAIRSASHNKARPVLRVDAALSRSATYDITRGY